MLKESLFCGDSFFYLTLTLKKEHCTLKNQRFNALFA